MIALFRNQPRPLFMIFMLEVWERFGFYTVQGILVLYFIRMLGFSQYDAYAVFGTFCALIYGMVPIGGYLGDKILGTKRTIVLGLVILGSGYAFLAQQIEGTLYWALAWICVGAALFKSNPGSLLAQCYEKDSPAIDSGFTLYYMAVNLGSIGSLLIGPFIAGRYGYEYAYMIASLGLVLGLLNYFLQYPVIAKIKTPADACHVSPIKGSILLLSIVGLLGLCVFFLEHPLIARHMILLMMGVFIIFYFICMAKATKKERRRLLLVFILMAEAIVFFTLYQQIPTSINLFAVNHVYPELLGFPIDPQSFQVFNPFWIMVLSPGLAYLYSYLTQREIAVGVPYKFAFGP